MKKIKLFMLLVMVSFIAACSDEKETWNTVPSVVEFTQQGVLKLRETSGIITIPVSVTGQRNNNIKLTFAVAETGTSPAKADVNYYVTEMTYVVTPDMKQGQIEIKIADDKEQNEDRTFQVSLVNAEGATLGSNLTVNVLIKDNDSQPYDRLQGDYTLTAIDSKNNAVSYDVSIAAPDDDAKNYGTQLYLVGLGQTDETSAALDFVYDEATDEGTLTFNFPVLIGKNMTFSGGTLTGCDVYMYNVVDKYISEDPFSATWTKDFNTITFDPNGNLYAEVYQGATNLGRWFWIKQIKLTRK